MLGEDVAAALPEFRAHAESLMVDECRIERQSGTTLDPATLEVVPTYTPIAMEQKCRVQRFRGQGKSDVDAGGYDFGTAVLLLQVPLSVRGVRRDDRLTVTAVDPISDPELVGVVASIREDLTKTHGTKRLLLCEEVSL